MSLTRTDTGQTATPIAELEKRSNAYRDMTDNQLLREALAKSNERCNDLIERQNTLIEDLTEIVQEIIVDYDIDSHSFSREEVAEVFTVPLSWLMGYEPYRHVVPLTPSPNSDFPFEKIVNGKDYQWRTRSMEQWFYDYENRTIWGLTARILKHFVDLLKDQDGVLF